MQGLHKLLLFQLLTFLGQHAHGSEIINGKIAPENSMLYMASVQDDKGHLCGGFLVSEDFVMSAAHCDKLNPTKVVVGTHNLKIVGDINKISIKYRYKHECYNCVRKGNDIMLLQLSGKVQLNRRVQPIQLPEADNKIIGEEKCIVAGWGITKMGGMGADDLQVVEVPIVKPEVCKREWEKEGVNLPDNVTCAGGYDTDKGFCQGDSGGPLVCAGKAVGIVSFNLKNDCDYPDCDYPVTVVTVTTVTTVTVTTHYPYLYRYIQIPSLDQRYSQEKELSAT